MSEPTAANDHEQHTTTIEITGNGQINAAFENTEEPDEAPGHQTPTTPPHIQRPTTPPPQAPRPNTPPPQIPTAMDTTHMNGETPHMNGDTKTNGVELRTPGSEDTKELTEAVNLELVNMQPYSNSIPIKKESTELDIGDPYDEYFVPVNQHKKYMRGEKLYVTQDKRRSLGGSKKKCCWGVLTVIVLGGIVAILLGVILTSQDNIPLEEGRDFKTNKAGVGGSFIHTPSPPSTPQPPRPTTDMSEIYLKNVLQGELTIDNLGFTPGLADHNSSEFRNLASSWEDELKSALFDHQTLHYGSSDITVKVIEFRPGSVIVVYRVGWEFKDGVKNPPDPIDKDTLKTRLQEHLRKNDGFLYNYRITLNNLKSERVTDVCKIDNGGCSQNCIFDRISLQIACACQDMYTLNSDGKTCQNAEPLSSEEASKIPSSEHEPSSEEQDSLGDQIIDSSQSSESSPEPDSPTFPESDPTPIPVLPEQDSTPAVDSSQEPSSFPVSESSQESQPSPATESSSEGQSPMEQEPSAETEFPIKHENSEINQAPVEQYPIIEPSSETMPENKTSELNEHVYYNSMGDFNHKSTSEPNVEQHPLTERSSSPETAIVGHNDYLGDQATEIISQIKPTDMTMDMTSSSEPGSESELSPQPFPVNVSESLEPLTATSMINSNAENHNVDLSNMSYETTPSSSMTYSTESGGPYHWSSETSKVPEMYEQHNEFSSGETSSAVPSTSSERLGKLNQLPLEKLEQESIETTTQLSQELKTMSGSPDYKTEQPLEYTHFYYSSSQPPLSFTGDHEEISTEKINPVDSEIKSYDRFMTSQSSENGMTSLSSTEQSYTEIDSQDGKALFEIVSTTNKSFDIRENAESHATNMPGEIDFNSNSSEIEDTKGFMTTMMPMVHNENFTQSNIFSNESISLHNNSEPTEMPSSENKTEYPPIQTTVMSFQNMTHETEMDTKPTEQTYFNISQGSEENSTVTTPSPSSLMESVDTNSNSRNQSSTSTLKQLDEMTMTTTEISSKTDVFVTPGVLNNTMNNPDLEFETNMTSTESAINVAPNQHSDSAFTYEELKIPMPDNMAPTFLEGENMPSIALTPNPDLLGPYPVDSTIQPVTEQEDNEEIKTTKIVNEEDASDTEVNHANQWSDSKNALNSLDDDYNEEEKYAKYKLVKGKPEHITKGYKSIKIDETVRVPQDNDALEQTHNHQIEKIPIPTTSESSEKLQTTEANENFATISPSQEIPLNIKEEEKMLIDEVYGEGNSVTNEPNINFEGSTELRPESYNFNTMKPIEFSQMPLISSGESPDSINNMTMKILEKELDPEGKIEQNISPINTDEKNNMSLPLDNLSSTSASQTTSSSLPSSETTFYESIPITTRLYEELSSSPKMEITCEADQVACRDGSRCLMRSQQCDGLSDCTDGYDEEGCEKLNCGENFKCNDGTCLSKHMVCNGLQNCPDGSDEENCDSEGKPVVKNNEQILEQSNLTEAMDTLSPEMKMELAPTEITEIFPSSSTEAPLISMEPIVSNTSASSSITPMEEVSSTTHETIPTNATENLINSTTEHLSSSSTEGTISGSVQSELHTSTETTINTTLLPSSSTAETSASSTHQEIMSNNSNVPDTAALDLTMTTMEAPSSSSETPSNMTEPSTSSTDFISSSMEPSSNTSESSSGVTESLENVAVAQSSLMGSL